MQLYSLDSGLRRDKGQQELIGTGYSVSGDGNPHNAPGAVHGRRQRRTLSGLDLPGAFTNVPRGPACWSFTLWCPRTGKPYHRLADQFQLPLLARLEWNPEILQGMEDHRPFPHAPFLPIAQALANQLLMKAPLAEYPPEVLSAPEPFVGSVDHPTIAPGPWNAFRDLSDQQWAVLLDLLPPRHRTGRTRVDDRSLLNGILWIYTTRHHRSAMPHQYGKWVTAKKRVERWKRGGYWNPILSQAREFGYAMTEGDFEQPDHDAAVLRDGNHAGQQARPGTEGAAEVPGGQPAQRSDHPAAAPTGDS